MKCLRCGTSYVKAGEDVCTTCQLKGYKTEKAVKQVLTTIKPDQIYYIDDKPYTRKEVEYLYYLRDIFGEEIYLTAKADYDRLKTMPVDAIILEVRDRSRALRLKLKD